MRRITTAARLTGPLLVRRFLTDYARNPVNLLMLVLVPAAFVAGAAGSLAQLAKLLSGMAAPGAALQTVTAGWAAAFIAAIAAYFQVRGARASDRRLVLAGLPAGQLAAARALTGLVLAVVASAAALVTLAARTGIEDPGRVLAGTFMFAVIYLAIGALAGTLVASPVNGTVLIFFVWMVDVMFGPASAQRPARPAGCSRPTSSPCGWPTCHHITQAGSETWAGRWPGRSAPPPWPGRY
jgi:hypothetical protein